ncbi:hypothetical protein BN1723_019248, partial [Verticillium longisporum]
RGQLPSLRHRRGQGPGLPCAHRHSVPGLAHGPLRSRRCRYCRDGFRKDAYLLPSRHRPHQRPASPRPRRRPHRPRPRAHP